MNFKFHGNNEIRSEREHERLELGSVHTRGIILEERMMRHRLARKCTTYTGFGSGISISIAIMCQASGLKQTASAMRSLEALIYRVPTLPSRSHDT